MSPLADAQPDERERRPGEADMQPSDRDVSPGFEREAARLESRFQEALDELRSLRVRLREADRGLADRTRAEISEIRDEWDAIHYRWWIGVLAGVIVFFFAAYAFYMNLGWYAEGRSLPVSSDWLLDRLPVVNLVPLLSWGWLALHVYALATAFLYYPRQLPFLFFLLGVYLYVRTVYVFLSPLGAPESILLMGELDVLFPLVAGVYTFQNEFIFSGHTAIPFLFALFFETRLQKTIMLAGSLAMAAAVLLTRNHYTVDVISAWLMGWAIFALSERLYFQFLRPLFTAAEPVRTLARS
jgi:hypothetical protein